MHVQYILLYVHFYFIYEYLIGGFRRIVRNLNKNHLKAMIVQDIQMISRGFKEHLQKQFSIRYAKQRCEIAAGLQDPSHILCPYVISENFHFGLVMMHFLKSCEYYL